MSNVRPGGGMTLSDFMNHSPRGGGRRNYIAKWKDKDPYAVTVWLSCRSSIYTLWRHGFQRVELVEDKNTKQKTREVWSDKLVCYEEEEVLAKLFWRDKATGAREVPPVLCPHCLMIEDVYQRVHVGDEVVDEMLRAAGKGAEEKDLSWQKVIDACHERGGLYWLEPLFRFNGNVRGKGGAVVADHLILHAGGLFNAFGSKHLTPDQKAAMAGVPKNCGGPLYSKNAWRENNLPKMEYVYVVVNHDDVAAGLCIAVEANLLGDKMRQEIGKAMKRAGGSDAGNPLLHPYAFRWEYDPSEGIEFNKKYEVTALDKTPLTPAIERLIRDTDPPDVTPLLAKFNLKKHRAGLENYGLVQLPWDDYFAPALKAEEKAKAAEKDPAAAAERRAPEVGRAPVAPTPRREPAPAPPPPPSPAEVEQFACDTEGCDAVLLATDARCPKCGAEYEVEKAPEPPPPPKPALPKRSQARAAAQQQAAPAPKPASAAPSLGAIAPPSEDAEDPNGPYPGDPTDDIPF